MKEQILIEGFAIIEDVYTDSEIENLIQVIASADTSKPTFRKTEDLFAIRQFFKEVPKSLSIVFNDKLNALIVTLFGEKRYLSTETVYRPYPHQEKITHYFESGRVRVVQYRLSGKEFGDYVEYDEKGKIIRQWKYDTKGQVIK